MLNEPVRRGTTTSVLRRGRAQIARAARNAWWWIQGMSRATGRGVRRRPLLFVLIMLVLFYLKRDPLRLAKSGWGIGSDSVTWIWANIVGGGWAILGSVASAGLLAVIYLRTRPMASARVGLITSIVAVAAIGGFFVRLKSWPWIVAVSAAPFLVALFLIEKRLTRLDRALYTRRLGAGVIRRFRERALRIGVVHYPPVAEYPSEAEVPVGPLPGLIDKHLADRVIKIEWADSKSLAKLIELLCRGDVDVVFPLFRTHKREEELSAVGGMFCNWNGLKVRVAGLTLDKENFDDADTEYLKRRARRLEKIYDAASWVELLEVVKPRVVVNREEAAHEILDRRFRRTMEGRVKVNEDGDLLSVFGPLLAGEADLIMCDCLTLAEIKKNAQKLGYATKEVLWDSPVAAYPCTIAVGGLAGERAFQEWLAMRWVPLLSRDFELQRVVQSLREQNIIL